jgi:hypothetical protein
MNHHKRVLSIDVGITSLGFCDINRDSTSYQIVKWGVLNLLERVGCEISAQKVSVPILIRILNILLPATFPDAYLYDSIVVEQQNARQSSQRKCVHISYIIYQYFNFINPHTKLVSANVKFNTHDLPGLSYVQPVFSPLDHTKTRHADKALAASTLKKKEYDHRKLYCINAAECFFTAIRIHHPGNDAFKVNLESKHKKSTSDCADALLLTMSELA